MKTHDHAGEYCRDTTLLALALMTSSAFGQATEPTLFVCNNGNLEGSTTSFRINADGTLTFVNRIVTGTRLSTNDPCAGCNAYEISLSPNGQYLATSHPAGSLDGITVFSVAANSAITQMYQLPLPSGQGGPLDLVWADDTHLIVNRLDVSPDLLVTYLWNPAVPTLTFVDSEAAGNSSSYLAKHPSAPYLYASDSGTNHLVRAYSIAPTGELTLIDAESVGTPFPLEIAISPDGTRLYGAGGISAGGTAVTGLNIALDGTLSPMLNSPYLSQGDSPSNVFVSSDGQYVVVGHGADATMRTMAIKPATGELDATGVMFDVGLQGTLGDVRVVGNHVFVTDNSTATDGLMGVYSFTLGANGLLAQNGSIISTQGIAPRSMAHWIPPAPKCIGDANGNQVVDIDDLVLVITNWNNAGGPGDVNSDNMVNIDDLVIVITNWGTCKD